MNKKIRQVLSVAGTEYVGWITNPRIIILGVLLIFVKALAIEPLAARAEKFGERLIVFEPFIAVGNSGMLAMLIPLVFLVLLADYPRLGSNTLFFISRTGKRSWLWGQLLFLISAILTFMSVILLSSILFSGGRFGTSWSDAVTKYNARFPNEAYNFDSQLIPSNLYNQIPMIKAVLQTFVLMSAYLFLLSLIIYLFKIMFGNSAGFAAATAVIALGVTTTSLYSELRWAFPMANTIMWLHYEEILREPIYPVYCSFLYFGIAVLALILLNYFGLRKINLMENNEL
ncbi:MAG: hypothetical protein J1F28_09750 [Oscillospiraceae bacterium]|nr:hypothetical protein [Oscillospiraceae bacterium]